MACLAILRNGFTKKRVWIGPEWPESLSEVLARLVAAAVFKIVEPHVNRAAGGFDSHALPLLSLPAIGILTPAATALGVSTLEARRSPRSRAGLRPRCLPGMIHQAGYFSHSDGDSAVVLTSSLLTRAGSPNTVFGVLVGRHLRRSVRMFVAADAAATHRSHVLAVAHQPC